MSEIHVRRIKSIIENEFSGLIDLSDLGDFPETEREKHFLTRAQSALALSQIAELNKETAALAVVDGFNDNGIDAIHFDDELGIMYVVQSKWDSTGNKSPDLGSIQKFIQGFKDLLSAKFDRFNDKLKSKQTKIEQALENPEVSFELVIVYTGSQPISETGKRALQDLLDEVNDVTDIITVKPYNQKELYTAISGGLERASITLDNVTLYEWGQIKDPYSAVYGQVSSAEIALWY
jgi:hypothetical protein